MQITGRGHRVFHEITRREAERGALACAGQRDREAVLSCQTGALPVQFVRLP